MRYYFYHLVWQIIDLIFPPRCAGCGEFGTRWCETCHDQVEEVQKPLCLSCGEPLDAPPSSKRCPRCRQTPPNFTAVRSWAVFSGPLRKAIHSLKYQNNLGLGEIMAEALRQVFQEKNWQVDLVVPVPLGMERFKERGYNQAALLAKPFAWRVGVPYKPRALQRVRETHSQVDLSLEERRENVAGAFLANTELVSGNTVLVIDDVTTTGSTLDACADALRLGNAETVYGLTLARALHS